MTSKPTRNALSLILVLSLFSGVGSANGKSTYTDYARVLHAEPIYRYTEVSHPQRTCRQIAPGHSNHTNHYQGNYNRGGNHRRNADGAVFIGALIGGAIGNEVSRSVNGRSSTGATIAGAVIGSALANAGSNAHYSNQAHNSHNQRRHKQNNHHARQHCTTTNHIRKERQLRGYKVTYQYHGRQFHTRTRQHPGNRIAIEVSLAAHR